MLLTLEFCDVCEAHTEHEVQVTPQGEVIRCTQCATVTAERN